MDYLSKQTGASASGRIRTGYVKDIGIDVDINCTADNNSVVQDPAAWDVYAMANVQAPTGDPEYWFTVFATSDATKNQGAYKNEKLDQLEKQLSQEFDTDKRAKLAVQMQQTVLDDNPLYTAPS